MQFYILPLSIVAKYQRMIKGNNQILFIQDKNENFVIQTGWIEDLIPEIDFTEFETIELTPEDFPKTKDFPN